MNTSLTDRYKHHRFPVEIISHGVWLYYRFCLSYRDVEELLFVRGVTVSYEAIRKWCRKFGQQYANQLRRRRPRPGDKGIWMRSFSRFMVSGSISGGPSIRMAIFSIS
jgi:putative transposase